MLYYAGVTKRIGDIDDGDTVMDYLKAERERGITINSAAITFGWEGHRINLIDTPGHVDFTMEVERAVRVLDGAVTILDGVAGVEAQTETVWKQADRYDIPRIAFVNKLDRVGGAFGRTVLEIWKKLRSRPLVIQLPWYYSDDDNGKIGQHQESKKGLKGIVDIVNMELVLWKNEDGSLMERIPFNDEAIAISMKEKDGEQGILELYQEMIRGRTALIETLAELDETIVDVFFEPAVDGDHMKVPSQAIKDALRRVTLSNQGIPILCGAAFKNMGVQLLLDAVIDYLPTPLDRPSAIATLNNNPQKTQLIPLQENGPLCALAFKVAHDPRRGPLVFVKVYSGKLNHRMALYNTTTRDKERVNKLLQMYAKDAEEVPSIHAGNIGVIVGLKNTRTGDTLVQSNDNKAIKNHLQLNNIDIPSPAFFAAIEPHSISDEPVIEEALHHLTREDPSLKVWTDDESGQRLISGMGELHLEIVKDRLLNDFKCKMDMGKMRISYRETCQGESTVTSSYDKELLGKRARATCQIHLMGTNNDDGQDQDEDESWIPADGGNRLSIDLDDNSLNELDQQHHEHDGKSNSNNNQGQMKKEDIYQAIHTGLMSGFARGAVLGFPLTKLKVKVSDLQLFGPESTTGAISACVAHGVYDAIQQSNPCLLEPMMEVYTEVNETHIGSVVSDLSGTRRGHVIGMESSTSVEEDENQDVQVYAPKDSLLAHASHRDGGYNPKHVIKAHVPLSSMLGYSSALRSLTGGSGNFSMRVIGYGEMSKDREKTVVNEMRGW
ncbi:P-loop containing nucleoside triphosphate hydrolase protein [Cunninghamella echinulata]|nr:P-loop containing nucleoside triphosphate hydrolase protein [Cunninghamella echinulata]